VSFTVGEEPERPFRLLVAGVGGQGTLTLAQIAMEVARRAGAYALQSEIHGMSQRGGAVHACLTIAPGPVSTPVIMEGTGDLLVALEPLEALRYVPLLRREAPLLVARDPIKTVADYPPEEQLFAALAAIPGCELVETESLTRIFRFQQAPGMVLLGRAARRLPFPSALWEAVVSDRLAPKGKDAVDKNLRAFAHGLGTGGDGAPQGHRTAQA
jgi:indolepyruvate ferredoxin oxidoreductase, beta subunit